MSDSAPRDAAAIPRLLTVRDLQDALRLSRAGVFDLRRSGVLPPPLKLGRSIRWRHADVEAALAKLAVATADETERQ